jgi:adenylate cyclase
MLTSFYLFIYYLQREKQKETVVGMLGNVLPEKVIQRFKAGQASTFAENFPNCTVMFISLCDFATLFDHLTPSELVETLDTVFSGYVQKFNLSTLQCIYRIQKIK